MRYADVRVIAATNKVLLAEVEAGHFRRDVYMRLSRSMVRLPPLRERGHDVTLLALHFLSKTHPSQGRAFSREALDQLEGYSWPGNVRQLRNVVEEAALSDDLVIGAEWLPDEVRAGAPGILAQGPGSAPDREFRTLAEVERRHVLDVYRSTGGSRARTARILGIDVKTLRRKLESYGGGES